MKKLIFSTLIVLGLISAAKAQSYQLTFSYDTSGNQTARNYVSGAKTIIKDTVEDLVEEEGNIEDALANKIKVYPNPTDGLIKVAWIAELTEDIKKITISDLVGKTWMVAPDQINNHSVEIDLTRNASGMYIIQFEFIKHPAVTKKITKN